MEFIYLEDPVSLYRCERAQLFLGFSADIRIDTHQQQQNKLQLTIELTPHAYVRESVLDYIRITKRNWSDSKCSHSYVTKL